MTHSHHNLCCGCGYGHVDMLKGQFDEIFNPHFFHNSNLPGLLTNGLKYFRKFRKSRWTGTLRMVIGQWPYRRGCGDGRKERKKIR